MSLGGGTAGTFKASAYSASAAAILASTSRSSASTRDDSPTRDESHQVGGLGFEAGDRAVAIRSMTAGVMAARN